MNDRQVIAPSSTAPATFATAPDLPARLPAVRGGLFPNFPLARITWFRAGGPAEILFRPADREDLRVFLEGCPAEIPITVIGVGSNLLVRDGGVPGVVVRLGGAMAEIAVDGPTLTVGAGTPDLYVARAARDRGLAGLEFLSGIPGTIGGALRMNAGAYGGEMARVLISATALGRHGAVHELAASEMGLGYRKSGVPADWIFVSGVLRGETGCRDAIAARMEEIRVAREASQPVRGRTGGSTFANPVQDGSGTGRAWELIDAAGCRGLRRGGAMVSEQHCNFLINAGDATARDIEALGEEVRRRVLETQGVELRWEIRRIGLTRDPAPAG